VTFGGRRIPIRRLRARTREGQEAELPSYTYAASRDPLDARTLEQMVLGVSTRGYARSLDRLPESVRERSVSKSAVSRRFVALTQQQLGAWLHRPLHDLRLRVLPIDGIVFRDHTILVVLGVSDDGTKHLLGLREGSTENAAVARALLEDLIERGLQVECAMLFVIDGSKALRRAIEKLFGRLAVVQRCQVHKQGNVRDHLPLELQASVARAMREAYLCPDAKLAQRQLERLAASLERDHPGAAASVREGLAETLTLQRLGLSGALYLTLRSTNPIEHVNSKIVAFTRRDSRWRGGAMLQRWVGAALIEAEKNFRRLRGHRSMPQLIAALDRLHQEIDTRTRVA
jgi:transposase-like protein